jgi:hypothetical protein
LQEVGIDLGDDEIKWVDTKEMISDVKHRIFFVCKAKTDQFGKPMGIGNEFIEGIKWFSRQDILDMKKEEFLDEFVWELRELL